MDKMEAKAERARLQGLLDGYEAGRLARQDEHERNGSKGDVTPDRADKVRARIAGLDEVIDGRDES